MVNSKYIIVDEAGLEVPVVFGPLLQHSQVAGGRKVISAGFCHSRIIAAEEHPAFDIYVLKWETWGESISLSKKSRPEDAEILSKYLEYDC